MRCSYQYYLRYVLGPSRGYTPRPGAALLWGKMGHTIIQRAYQRVPLAAAHRMVWEELAYPILDELDEWYALDCELRQVKGAPDATQARPARERCSELSAAIDEFQADFLTDWRWEGKHLTKFYRWSQALAHIPPEELLLPDPVLVEGEWTVEPRAPSEGATGSEDEGVPGKGRWLQGEFDEVPVPVVGIPDVIARLSKKMNGEYAGATRARMEGGLLFADYKFSRIAQAEDIEQDLQLLLYVELARQRGIVLPGQPVWVGHIYPTEKGEVVKVLAGTALHALLLPELRRLFRDMARDVAEGRFHRVRGIDHFSVAPCGMCDVAHLCDPGREALLPDEV
jgi:PD-(D/E)XK nuclease superfamily